MPRKSLNRNLSSWHNGGIRGETSDALKTYNTIFRVIMICRPIRRFFTGIWKFLPNVDHMYEQSAVNRQIILFQNGKKLWFKK